MGDSHFWNAIAPRYARKAVANPEAFERKIAITQQHLTCDSRVLDIGCGTGSLALRLAARCSHVQGLDSAVEVIRVAERKAAEQGVTNVAFANVPFEQFQRTHVEASFDVVCAFSILHLVRDRDAMLGSVFRLLRPGGIFVTSTSCLGESRIPYTSLLRFVHATGRAPYVAVFKKRMLRDEISRVGFMASQEPLVGAKKEIAFVVAVKPL